MGAVTERLFDLDPYLKEFTARVVRSSPRGVILDCTAFYPTAGGQPCDLGTLNGVEVTDVVEEDDAILHVVSGPVQGEVRGVIDWDRRRDHMQQHHGQHLLSEAFVQVARAQTTSFHLGRETCSIELDKPVGPLDLERAETLANMVVCDSRPVQVSFYGAEEARTLPLRKPPPSAGRVRVVSVQGFDVQACCGTHPRSTGEVGVVMITGWEKAKDGARVHFACGFRALREARENVRQLRALGQKLSAGRGAVEEAVDRLLGEAAGTRKALEAAERALAGHAAREMAARGPLIAEVLEGKDLDSLRRLATEVVKTPGRIVVLGGTGPSSSLVLARSADVPLDLRPIFQEAVARVQGKGGGAPDFVQGGGPGPDVRAAVASARERILAARPG